MRKTNKGSSVIGVCFMISGIVIILMFIGVIVFQQIYIGTFHDIKNDLYMINRNVLFSLQRNLMGEDKYDFYESEVKTLVEEEIKRLWNADVSKDTENGIVRKVDVIEARIINNKDELKIKSSLRIYLRPILFGSFLDKDFSFMTNEVTSIKKMRGWDD